MPSTKTPKRRAVPPIPTAIKVLDWESFSTCRTSTKLSVPWDDNCIARQRCRGCVDKGERIN